MYAIINTVDYGKYWDHQCPTPGQHWDGCQSFCFRLWRNKDVIYTRI